jgi:hypothetical protein
MRKFALIAVSLFAVAMFASAQMNMSDDKSKRPSPPASAACKFSDGKTIKIDYSSPRAKGRKIFGEASEKALVPYGQIWRTGANDATTFVTDTNLNVGGKAVPAGNYTIFTVPKADAWSLVISKKTGEWGTDYPDDCFENFCTGRELHHRLRPGRQQMHAAHRVGKHPRQRRDQQMTA